jgi:outer membrane biosynthesis protein TonB
MADTTRKEERRQRSESRDRRRRLATRPFEQLDEAAQREDERAPGGEMRAAVKRTIATAAAGALVAGVAGAAKAVLDREDEGAAEEGGEKQARPRQQEEPRAEPQEPPAGEEEPDDEPQARAEEPQEPSEDEAEPQAEEQEQPAPQPEEPQAQAETQQQPEEAQAEDRAPDEETADEPVTAEARDGGGGEGGEGGSGDGEGGSGEGRPRDERRGADSGQATAIVEAARRQLEAFVGSDAERVSGFERSDNHWAVTLEVVEVPRIPATTDILASYEVVLDDERNVVGFSQKRRYIRTQSDERS